MCGRYSLVMAIRIENVLPEVDLSALPPLPPRYNIAPTQAVLVSANRVPVGGRRPAELFRWGLIPSWAKDPTIGNRMINARAETVAQKPSYMKSLERRRCLVWADGFYEWKKNRDGTKTPMYIRMKDQLPFALAGLWDRWKSPEGEDVHSCTIITTTPNELMAGIHDRMPVILPREALPDWLDPAPRAGAALQAWLRPYAADALEAYAVSTRVNAPRNDEPGCIEPCAAAP